VTNNSGGNWSLGQPLQMQVIADSAAVPEPGTFWLAVPLGALLVLRLRTMRRT